VRVELLDIADVASTWRPETVVRQGQIDAVRAAVLADLLGTDAPTLGEPLRPLWHEIYLREQPLLSELGDDGHPRSSELLPPIRNRRRMFGGSEVRVVSPLRVGESVRRTVQIGDVRLKAGSQGDLLVVTEEHRWHADGDLRLTEKRHIIYRSANGGMAAVSPAPSAAGAPGAVDERTLFLFSLLTSNVHRIHYDAAYAREVEAHRGLLVHGPLTALLGAETVYRETNRPVSTYDYRLVAPCYAHSSLTFAVTRDGAKAFRVAGETDGRTCLTAIAGVC
jgi:hydroxyacyl-ACP dehydratase HTD2-like protein with hotdog domain